MMRRSGVTLRSITISGMTATDPVSCVISSSLSPVHHVPYSGDDRRGRGGLGYE
jgi:hypothetical protein